MFHGTCSGSDTDVDLNPVQKVAGAGEGGGVASLTCGGGTEGGDAVGRAVQVEGTARGDKIYSVSISGERLVWYSSDLLFMYIFVMK